MTLPLAGRTIGITGVSGFIGGHLARRCTALGASVRGLDLRPPREQTNGEFHFVPGDVTREADAAALCAGCDSVIHTAAVVREGGDPRPFERINVGGTRAVARAAERAGVNRFIQISSVMVYGFGVRGEVDEGAPLDGAGNPYCQTKIDSEREALAVHSSRMQVGVVRCGDVYGPGSIPWTIRPVKMMLFKRFRLIDGGSGLMNHVYIDNLVDGILLALDSPVTGEAFNISDGVGTPFREFFGYYAAMVGLNPMVSMSAGAARRMLIVQNALVRLLGKQPRLHSSFVSYVTRQCTYSIARARAVLGYEPRVGLEEGMQFTEAWLRSSGILPPR
jgi:nucleoside-diphosphate-sugar epimerase